MGEEYLTIKEFAAAAGVSEQAIYKRINKSLKPYAIVIGGKKKISIEGLALYQQPTQQPTKQPTFNNQVETSPTEGVPANSESLDNSTLHATSLTTEQEQIKSLNRMVDIIQKELEVKNKQIDDLNARLAEALKTVEAQNILISQQQHLALLDKTDKQQEKSADIEEELSPVIPHLDRQVLHNTNQEQTTEKSKKSLLKRIFGL